MRKTLRSLLASALIVALAGASFNLPLFNARLLAQTTLTQTTTSAAVSATATTVSLTSTTGVTAGSTQLYIDKEAMAVTALNGSVASVRRGIAGTAVSAHVSGSAVILGPGAAFTQADQAGACTASATLYTPALNVNTGSIFICPPVGTSNPVATPMWTRALDQGFSPFGTSGLGMITYTVAGAINIAPGVHFINGTTLAMTIANPPVWATGMVMVILSTNASAHTLTYTAGFGGGTTSRDVATFGGAVNDGLVIVAVNGTWWVISTRNVTLA